SDRPAELISYLRADQTGPRTSLFHRTLIPEPERLKPLLADALGLLGVVAKRRELWLFEPAAAVAVPHVRIHLDEVERLGTFLEFEAIMPATADDAA
ncbi:MAG TPA: CYTH domain-containing protein, partial [Gemmatales bacterium]|nr:CYTH domain-containing protein [Gemmatales bacterium]